MNNVFPFAIVALFYAAAAVQAYNGRWNEAVYSFSAGMLNTAVYFRPF
jgi:hypothetical protein